MLNSTLKKLCGGLLIAGMACTTTASAEVQPSGAIFLNSLYGASISTGDFDQSNLGFSISSSYNVLEEQEVVQYTYSIANSYGSSLGASINEFQLSAPTSASISGDLVTTIINSTANTNVSLGDWSSVSGLKFDFLEEANAYLLTFQSKRLPTLGNFFVSGDNGSTAYNTGSVGGPHFVWTPGADLIAAVTGGGGGDTISDPTGPSGGGGGVENPEPGTYLMLGITLFAVGMIQQRRRGIQHA